MKKLINVSLIILAISIILSSALSVFATVEIPEDEVNIFDKEGEDYIAYDPFENKKGSWHIMGPRAVKNEGSENPYPIIIDNREGNADSFYYVAGSNNMRDLTDDPELIKYLENDFVVEYEVKYGLSDISGHISLALAYNYHKNFHIDAYVANDGTGDIAIVTDKGATSVLSDNSILDPESADKLIEAIYGKGKATRFADPFMISLRVTVNENKMPVKIYMYINGCLIAETNEEFAAKVNEITPEYTISADGEFPTNTLGNIIAIKSSVGSVGEINKAKAYTVSNQNYTPNGFSAKDYADKYGNESFDPSMYPELEENSTEQSTEEITESNTESSDNTGSYEVGGDDATTEATDTTVESESCDTTEASGEEETTKRNRHDDDDEDEYLIDVISTVCLILGCASAAIIVAAVVILKLRTKEK